MKKEIVPETGPCRSRKQQDEGSAAWPSGSVSFTPGSPWSPILPDPQDVRGTLTLRRCDLTCRPSWESFALFSELFLLRSVCPVFVVWEGAESG